MVNRFTSWFWFGNEKYCKCCHYIATNLARSKASFSDIENASRSGCLRCTIILKGLSNFAYFWEDALPDGQPYIHQRQQTVFVKWSSRSTHDGLLKFPMQQFLFAIDEGTIHCSASSCLNVSVAAPEVLPDLLVRRGIVDDSSSDICFDTIKTWFENCSAKHNACKAKATEEVIGFLPTRLIDVHAVKLTPADQIVDKKCKYAALSHSWGLKAERKKPVPKLRNSNQKDRQKGIVWHELTKTFQDAIIAARRLGLDYLWIDSLCIIQDNDDDWAVQSSQMGKIYGEADLVISATRSNTGDMGLFHVRDGAHHIDVNGYNMSVRLQHTHDNFFTAHKPKLDQNPLFTRGWCFQERILAKRIIHFTAKELIWECNEQLWCECQTIQREAEDRMEGHSTRKEFKRKLSTLLRSQDQKQKNQCWLDILAGYSARSLTFESDRLPALSGIVQQVATPERGRYLAGMWESDLPQSLLWYPPMMRRELRKHVVRSPGVPTWAWPAVGMEIAPHIEKHKEVRTVAEVLEVQCSPKTADPFGQVKGGHLLLKAPVVEVKLVEGDHEDYKALVAFDDDVQRFWPDSYSTDYLPPDGSTVLCLGIQLDMRESHLQGFSCLILRSSTIDHEFLRIGKMNCPSRWAQRAETRTVKIL
ncbi:hypothetical protein H2198_004317 [Neophaeococcomyces mojaviensis]|uniref:Uncharacterized protein n=1 Tax=Neophaeococcomyces mojaviensis TaxID=3383035 RepID=A0ACC3A8X1_9EURO|nr:hypothetical protein H2198_004317 [Knufia sp. JES_112]